MNKSFDLTQFMKQPWRTSCRTSVWSLDIQLHQWQLRLILQNITNIILIQLLKLIQVADQVKAKTLILSHVSPRYRPISIW